MFSDTNFDLSENFLKCQRAFFAAAIQDTFDELGLDKYFQIENTAENIAAFFKLNIPAVKRFLNAAASINLIEKLPRGNYILCSNKPSYTSRSSEVIFLLFEHNIPEILNAAKSMTASEVSSRVKVDMVDLLESAVKFNLLQKRDDERYSNFPELEKYLLSSSNQYIGPKITHYRKIMFPMFSKKGLMGALKTGHSQWAEIFGEQVTTPFDIYRTCPVLLEDFSQGLHRLNMDDDRLLAEILHLDCHTVLDVGGGSGAWALQLIAQAKANVRIDIYELPDAIPMLQKILYKYAPAEKRIKYISGSFFNNPESIYLEGLSQEQVYDIISLGWILHDWSDETNILILKKVKSHLKSEGRLILLEALLPETRLGANCISDLAMLLQTEGHERTFEEYKGLLELAGFKDIAYEPTKTRRQMIIAK